VTPGNEDRINLLGLFFLHHEIKLVYGLLERLTDPADDEA
jgi:hypothetical protein